MGGMGGQGGHHHGGPGGGGGMGGGMSFVQLSLFEIHTNGFR